MSGFNIPEFSVSDFSRSIKTLVEDAFGYVKINGEISGFKRAASGHLYFSLKDEKAVLSAVCFRNMAQMIDFEIADGLQVCVSGRVTTYEGRSNYQIIVEKVEIAGVGAILEMIEKRRQKLLAEGLFDDIHKKPIPFFPKIIAIITSETGAVIEDIKHRISDRSPTHLMVYPSLMQGEKAPTNVIAGIKFFNNVKKEKRPDVIIIARGGGSFEDLLTFNDENLVREVFKSEIPIISAIGHETDFTLIDYVADLRAPTPTAAAEFATPIFDDLKSKIKLLSEKLEFLPRNYLAQNKQNLKNLQRYIADPKQGLNNVKNGFLQIAQKLDFLTRNFFERKSQKLNSLQISSNYLSYKLSAAKEKSDFLSKRLELESSNKLKEQKSNLENLSKFLKANNYREILKRGFALIKDENNNLISSVTETQLEEKLFIEVSDGNLETRLLNKTKTS